MLWLIWPHLDHFRVGVATTDRKIRASVTWRGCDRSIRTARAGRGSVQPQRLAPIELGVSGTSAYRLQSTW